ncbi:MAG: DUF3084 domain-containing protein [Fimbriimonadaceae bacterium]|nr:DUF3084 domain-containing protein [Fimbriimonadaceae bacterium]
MDVGSIGFLLLMALMGGGIAVFADRLGRKLGKSRHTLFGMRPRKTAEVLTFAAGFLIPIVTLLVVIAISSSYRQWFVRGAQAYEDAKRYEKQAADLQEQVDNLMKLKEQTAKDFEQKNKELLTVLQQRKEIEAKRLALQGQVATLNSDIGKLNAGVRKLQEQTAKINAQYLASKKDYDRVKMSFDIQNDRFKEISIRNTEIERANAQLERDQEKLRTEVEGLQGKITELEKERTDLEQQVAQAKADYQKELNGLNNQLNAAKLSLTETQRQLSEAQRDYVKLQNTFGYARTQRITYYQNEELVRVFLPPRLTEEQARGLLNSLLRQSITAAEARGAAANETPSAAMIMPAGPEGAEVSTREQIELIIQRIRNLPDYTFIAATSRLNAFVNEPVALEVRLFHNPVIYEVNEQIADVRIDGSRSDGEIFDELTKFFSEIVRPEAIKKGMIPTLGSESGLGSLSTSDVLQLIRRIRDVNAPVRVSAHAVKQTRAGDRLEFVFRFR